MSKELLITVDTSLPGNLSECSICGEKVLPNEEYFDYEYWGHNEIVHNRCAYPNENEAYMQEAIDTGYKSMPIVVLNGEVVASGFQPDKLNELEA